MLNFVFTDVDDEKVELCDPVSLTINKEENVPADDMVVKFPYISVKELKTVVVSDDEKVVFTGVVDEQQTVMKKNGEFLLIVCRSMAAVLLDNESVPISYTNPSTDIIEMRHIKPYNLCMKDNDNSTYFGTLTIPKGASQYKAVEDFCKNMYHCTPRINELSQVELVHSHKDPVCIFSNDGDGVEYFEFSENLKRCEEISRVSIKLTNSCGYNSIVQNDDAIKRGITRQRYINSLYTQTPAQCAQSMINNSKEKSYSITLVCVGAHPDLFLRKATVSKPDGKMIENLYVSALRYCLSADKDVTTVTLKRREV